MLTIAPYGKSCGDACLLGKEGEGKAGRALGRESASGAFVLVFLVKAGSLGEALGESSIDYSSVLCKCAQMRCVPLTSSVRGYG